MIPQTTSWPNAETMIPELLREAPVARVVLDRYGLRGCGGSLGPAETLDFFSRAHDVPLDGLLDELRAIIAEGTTAATSPDAASDEETLADTIYRPFFRAGIAVVLSLGSVWGALLLVRIALAGSFAAVTLHEVNAHGHAQIFGWVGLFVMGFAYQAFPRFKHTSLAHPRWAYASFWLMLGGLVTRSLLEPLTTWWAWLGPVAVAGSGIEIVAVGIFIWVLWATLRSSAKAWEPYDFYVLAALGWFLVHTVYEAVYLAATLQASNREQLLGLVATWQGPLREIQIYGFATMMILGVSQRLFHYFYSLPAPNRRRSLVTLATLNAALIGLVTGFVLMRAVGHAWASLWYGSVLAIAGSVVYLVADWHLFSTAPGADRSLKFLRAGYVWLFISLGMLVLLPAYQFVVLPALAPASAAHQIGFSHAYYGAIRHAITVGFISLMIMGVAAKVVPTLGGIDVHKLGSLWFPFVLVNTGCAMRVGFQTLTDFAPSVYPLAGISGLLEVTGLAIWGVHLWGLMARRDGLDEPETAAMGARPEATGTSGFIPMESLGLPTAITPDQTVADVLRRCPWLLETFVSAGFTPLQSSVARRTLARLVTIRQACERMEVDLEPLLAKLNERRRRGPVALAKTQTNPIQS
jgi:hypothetical protein